MSQQKYTQQYFSHMQLINITESVKDNANNAMQTATRQQFSRTINVIVEQNMFIVVREPLLFCGRQE